MDTLKEWKVFSKGKIKPGYDKSIVTESLQTLFKIEIHVAEKLLEGRAVVIRKNISEEQAKKYLAALGNIGVDAYVESPDQAHAGKNAGLSLAVIEIAPAQHSNAEKPEIIMGDASAGFPGGKFPNGQMQCPRCGKIQEKALDCSGCGIIIDKFKPIETPQMNSNDDNEYVESKNPIVALFSNIYFIGVMALFALIYKIFIYNSYDYVPVGSTPEAQAQMSAQQAAINKKDPTIDYVHNLLTLKNYAEVDATLYELDANFKNDVNWEMRYLDIFDDFSIDNKFHKALFDGWVNSTGSAMSYLARGCFYMNEGWEARGEEWASETSSSQFAEMNRLFELAAADLNQAKLLDKSLIPIYSNLISMSKTDSSINANLLVKEAMIVNPGAISYRISYLNGLEPRWGGSYEEMAEFIESTKPYIHLNPRLYRLLGEIDSDKAHVAMSSNEFGRCISLYSEALKFGVSARWLTNRAWCLMKDENYKLASLDINLSLEMDDTDIMARKIKSYVDQKLR